MRKTLVVFLAAALVLSGCDSWRKSRVNPSNWGGGEVASPENVAIETDNELIPQRTNLFKRPDAEDLSRPIANITELRVERTTTGAIIMATGVASRQGAYDAELRPDPVTKDTPKGLLSYTFVVVYPKEGSPAGSELSRTVRAAVSLSTQELAGVRTIQVSAAENARQARRR